MSEPWHLDKKVPIALIATITFQSIAAIWWAATITNRVNDQQTDIDRIIVENKTFQQSAIRTEENVKEINRSLLRLESGQDKVNALLEQILTRRNFDEKPR